MAGLVGGHPGGVVLLVLPVVEEDVPAAVAVGAGVGAARVVALVVAEVRVGAGPELDVAHRTVPDLGAVGDLGAEGRRAAGVVGDDHREQVRVRRLLGQRGLHHGLVEGLDVGLLGGRSGVLGDRLRLGGRTRDGRGQQPRGQAQGDGHRGGEHRALHLGTPVHGFQSPCGASALGVGDGLSCHRASATATGLRMMPAGDNAVLYPLPAHLTCPWRERPVGRKLPLWSSR